MTQDGGPAFPNVVETYQDRDGQLQIVKESASGMSLRDWFAGQALAGLVAQTRTLRPDVEANYAYKLADAMIAERAKGEKP